MSEKRKKIGLALGGGGAKAFAHLGVIDVLKENNINIDLLSTSSAGSLMGVLIAHQIKTRDIKKIFYQYKTRLNWFRPHLSFRSLLSDHNTRNILKKLLKNKKKSTKIPIYIIATNLNMGQSKIFTPQNLSEIKDMVCASMAFPGFYPPVKINHQYYIDGGILNNIPADVCRQKLKKDDLVISISLDEILDQKINHKNLFSIIYRSIYLSLFNNRQKNINQNSDYVLGVFSKIKFNFKTWRETFTFYSVKKMEYFYQLGRSRTLEHLDEIKKIIK